MSDDQYTSVQLSSITYSLSSAFRLHEQISEANLFEFELAARQALGLQRPVVDSDLRVYVLVPITPFLPSYLPIGSGALSIFDH